MNGLRKPDVNLDALERICERKNPEGGGFRVERLENLQIAMVVRLLSAHLRVLELHQQGWVSYHSLFPSRHDHTSFGLPRKGIRDAPASLERLLKAITPVSPGSGTKQREKQPWTTRISKKEGTSKSFRFGFADRHDEGPDSALTLCGSIHKMTAGGGDSRAGSPGTGAWPAGIAFRRLEGLL